MRRTEFGHRYASCISQTTKCSIATFCAFKDLAGDVPPNPVFLGPDCKHLACPFEGDFHIGQRPGIKAVRNHNCLLILDMKPPQ